MKVIFVVILSIVLLINEGVYAQKNQIKSAQELFQKSNYKEALKILNATEYLIVNATDEEKSDFYFLKGNVLKSIAESNVEKTQNLLLALEAYQELIKYESYAEKLKYTQKANDIIKEIKSTLVDGALEDFKAGKFKESAQKSYNVYVLDKKDTLNLFNAASSSLMAKDYNLAFTYYEELRKLNYSGNQTRYYATNKKTKQEENFISASERDKSVKVGTHTNARNDVIPSKKIEVNKNLAFIYIERRDIVNAEKCYNKVLEIEPNYIDAYINLVYSIFELKKSITEEMNNLGNTRAEMKLYDELKIKKDGILKSAIPYLKKALTIDPKNADVLNSLMGVYKALDMTEEYNKLKANMS